MSWLLLLLLTTAHGGYLRMVGTPHLRIQEVAQKLVLTGDYQIVNEGDEQALQVFPELRIDGFRWKGSPEDLQPGQGAQWDINEVIEPLCLKTSEKCLVALPERGVFLVKVSKHYEDLNQYQFNVPDLFTIDTEEDRGPTEKSLELTVRIHPPPAGESEYRAEFTLKNRTENLLKVVLNPLLPQEMKLLNSALPVEIPPEGQVEGSFEFQNTRGTPGSHYVGFVTAEWSEEGKRLNTYAFGTFQIQSSKPVSKWSQDQVFLGWLLWMSALGLMGMWFFWIRPLKKLNH